MMRTALLLAATALASPALAQQSDPHAGHATTAVPEPAAAACTAEHAAMGHCELPETPAAPSSPAPAPTCTAEHAAMGHCKLEETPSAPPPPVSACTAEHAAMGHCTMPAAPQADPHAGHDMRQAPAPDVPVTPPPPDALLGPAHAADAVWGSAMERSRNILREEHGGMPAAKFLVDRAESSFGDGRDGYLLDMQAWYGGDIDKLWLKSEVEGPWGERPEHAEVQALWSHAIGPWFDLQTGIRFDPQPGPNRTHFALGVQGLAPYWWEVEGTVFLSNKGELTAHAEAEYDLRITQKLVLQPRVEVALSAQDIPELAIGAGLSEASFGLRLRYQVSPLVAPYIGVEYEHAFSDTRDFRRAEGEKPDGVNLLAGVRFWF